jgi:dCTP deaminase
LHLDNYFKIFKPHSIEIIDPKKSISEAMQEIKITDDNYFIIHPGHFVLALVYETTGVDNKHVGRLEGKSSLARLGLIIHTTAGFLDPGNKLKLTLELYNAGPLPIKLYPKMKIAQIAFEEISSDCERPYGSKGLNSKYFGDTNVSESKIHLNFK